MKKKKETKQQRWYRKNRTKVLAYMRRLRQLYPERQKAAFDRWMRKNRAHYLASMRRWRRNNPERVRASNRRSWLRIKADPVRYAKHKAASLASGIRRWRKIKADAVLHAKHKAASRKWAAKYREKRRKMLPRGKPGRKP